MVIIKSLVPLGSVSWIIPFQTKIATEKLLCLREKDQPSLAQPSLARSKSGEILPEYNRQIPDSKSILGRLCPLEPELK